MKALVACEESQAITIELRKLGVEAYSCDIQECSGGHPEWHIKQDVLEILNPKSYQVLNPKSYQVLTTKTGDDDGIKTWIGITFRTMDGRLHIIEGKWDLIIAHPPCTDLASSGARWFLRKRADGSQQRSVDFFMHFTDLDCPHVVIENPIGIMSTIYRKPDQIIQPYEYGHPVRKSTCLWLKGIPKLTPSDIVPFEVIHSAGRSGGYSGPSWMCRDENDKIISWNDPRTARIRSKTYSGIAHAMATQWVPYIRETEGIE